MSPWPNFFIAGVPKAGTSSLYSHLEQHPELYLSPVKEPHFFSQIRPKPELRAFFKHVSKASDYQALFTAGTEYDLRGEASTSYFWDQQAPFRIRETISNPRFIILLREPIARAHSHYLDDSREGIERRNFFEAVLEESKQPQEELGWGRTSLYLDNSLYTERLERYFSLFGRQAVLVLVFEEFIAAPREHLRKVFEFLGVDPELADSVRLTHKNRYSKPRGRLASAILGSAHIRLLARRLTPPSVRQYARGKLLVAGQKPEIDPACRSFLQQFFSQDIESSEELLETSLPWRAKLGEPT